MDMTPPQAPPAQTQRAYQEAIDAFDRIVGLQAWLAVEQSGMPALPETAGPGTLPPYLLAVDTYWNAAPTNGPVNGSRRAEIATRIANAARDLAVLAASDGSLDDTALALVRSVTAIPGGTLPAGIRVREPMLGQVPYAGVLLVQDNSIPDRTLVFSHDRGWESFAHLVDAHAALERRVRLALVQSRDLPGIARQHLSSIDLDTSVDSREIVGDPFGGLVDQLIGVQRDRLQQAWFEYSLAEGDDARAQAFVDSAFDALRLDRLFDVETALAARHATLMETFNAQRLARVPSSVASDWLDADDRYRSALQDVVVREVSTRLPLPMDLSAYASDAMGERLRALGVTADPADIHIRIDRRADVTARLESLQALFEGPAPSRVRLIDLAYQNIAAFERVSLSGETSDGNVIAALNDEAIRGIVRRVDLSSRYPAYVDAMFRSGNDATMRRENASTLQRAHMRHLAAEARLSYYLNDVPRSFRDDRAERGYRWVKAVLDAPTPARRQRIDGHDIVVQQITYLGTPLRDVLAVGVRQPGSVPSIVLYTPDAPDGITFREFEDRAQAARQFFYHPAFREYLLDRLPAEYARVQPNGSVREFAGDHLANWVLGSSAESAYTRTEAPFGEREVTGDFLAASYEVDVQLGLRNVQSFTRSAEQANWAWLVAQLRGATVDNIVGNAIKGVVTSPAHAAQAAWRLYDNVKAGDRVEAFVDFADFYNASLAVAAPFYALSGSAVAHAMTGARFRTAGRLVDARPAVQPVVVFEARFAAKSVRKTGQVNREGIFTIEGRTYIEHGGQLYRVVHDSDYGSWRLSRPDAGAAFRGPAIQRTPAGTWAYRRVGLRGGSGRGMAGSPERLPDLYDELQAEVELAFPDPAELERVAARIRFETMTYEGPLSTPPALISEAQRVRWTDALTRARARKALRAAQPGGSAGAPPLDLSVPRTGHIGGFRGVPRTEAPAALWYYGKMPFKNSGLMRHRGQLGYDLNMAELANSFIDQSVYGVRLTTVAPTASIERIRQAMGRPDLARGTTFSVRVDPHGLYEPMSPAWRQRYWMSSDTAPNAELLVPRAGPGNVYIARPHEGVSLKLDAGQFYVENTLPPPVSP